MDADDLYGLPLDRFVPERTALVKELRGAGEREEAARVAKLAKPSVAAWAVNQLVRTQRAAVTELFEAGDALQRAHADVIAGNGNAQALREAGERERAAVDGLLELARGLLSTEGKGLTPATLERVAETLHAAARDGEARASVSGASLARELTRVGLGEGAFSPNAPAPTPRQATTAGTAARRGAKEAARQEAAREKARRAAEDAARELEVAQERRDRAAAALKEAEDALARAKSRAEEAAQALS